MRDKLKTYTAKEIKHLLDILPFGFEHDGKFIAVDDLLNWAETNLFGVIENHYLISLNSLEQALTEKEQENDTAKTTT